MEQLVLEIRSVRSRRGRAMSIPAGTKVVPPRAFTGDASITSLVVPSGVEEISDGSFAFCASLTSLTLPPSVKVIGDSAFASCTALTSVTIPASVEKIGPYAFGGCSKMTSLTVPSSVNDIGAYAFCFCPELKQLSVGRRVLTRSRVGMRALCARGANPGLSWTARCAPRKIDSRVCVRARVHTHTAARSSTRRNSASRWRRR